jgi:hypothetical protein
VKAALHVVLFAALVAPAGIACGNSDSFPDPPPCATPPVISGSASNRGAQQVYAQFVNTLRAYADHIRSALAVERSHYPERSFSRDDNFRPTFAAYADDTICTANQLIAVKPPFQGLDQFETALKAAATALIDHVQAGREAVRSRNVTDFRTWYDGVQAKTDALIDAADAPNVTNIRRN